MAFLKINKAELVNRSYSLKREIIGANRTGAYCNTTIVCCNTRRYHGLFAVTLDRFGGDKYMLLSSLDESIIIDGKRFNLGIHCYGDVYYPRGHKYVVNFEGDPLPCITYKVGDVLFRKTILLVPDKDRLMIKYEVLESPSGLTLQLMPFLSFRNVHALTSENSEANLGHREIENGEAFNMYKGFPDLCLQFSSSKKKFVDELHYIDENEMLDLTAIAQSSPGAIAVNAAILVGYRVGGFPGAMVSLMATVLPPLIIISIISSFYQAFRDNIYVSNAMTGMLAGVAAVITDVVLNMSGDLVKCKKILPVVMMILSFIAVRYFKVNIILLIAVCGAIGAIQTWYLSKAEKERGF